MGRWTKWRERLLTRWKKGTFKEWRGGKRKSELKKKENTYQGIATHVGKEFKRQHGRVARVGEAVRTRTKDGTYHKQAMWYVRTKVGWRKHGDRKPAKE